MVDAPVDAKPYHHGDLRRALVEAADRLLEREGANALSLRAVAREAGVSAAAPYHHFKDKNELLAAVARLGFDKLAEAMRKAIAGVERPIDRLNQVGVTYVCFARENMDLYHLMFDPARNRDFRADIPATDDGPKAIVMQAIRDCLPPDTPEIDIQLAQIAGWCASHGLAEMAGNKDFDGLKAELGGERNFFSQVLSHMDMDRSLHK
jgi:AcrR family transcriptional regulator